MRPILTVLAVAASLVGASASLAAPPKLNFLFPAGAQRGQAVEVTATGSFDVWPVSAWVDRPGVTVTAKPDKGQLTINVAADAEPGPVWIRLHNREGATALKPFFIGSLPEVLEAEPNDDPAKPQVLQSATVISGRLGKREDVDLYAIPLRRGDTLVASLVANFRLGSGVDCVLQVCSPQRFILDQNDDAVGIDPRIVFQAPADGVYLVRVFGFPETPDSSIAFAGNDAFVYRLTLTTGPFVDHCLPLAVTRGQPTEMVLSGSNIPSADQRFTVPGASTSWLQVARGQIAPAFRIPVIDGPSLVEASDTRRDKPQAVTLPATITGVLAEARDEDAYVFSGRKGEAVSFELESDSLGFLLDGVLTVVDAAGKVLAEADDAQRNRDPRLTFTPAADGEYRIVVGDVYGHGGPRYVYRLTARPPTPSYTLQAPGDTFAVKPGETVELTLAVNRQDGFAREIEISAVGLPAGVSAEPVKSLASGDTQKSVKLVLKASSDAQSGSFRLQGRAVGEPPLERLAELKDAPPEVADAWVSILRNP